MSAPAGDERSRLLRALALSQRFHLFLAYCASPRAADQLVRALEDELPRLRKASAELVRLDPYEGRESDTPLEDRELAEKILIPLLSPLEDRKAHGVVHIVDASRTTAADTDAWGKLFALWNEKRNALQQLGGEVLVVLPESLKRLFATAAPDVWSIRSGEYAIEEETSGVEVMGARGSPSRTSQQALGWYRALPPLALFGGDLLVSPWMKDIVHDADVEGLTHEPAFRGGLGPDERARVQRALRSAEHALGQRRFDEVEDICRLLSEHLDDDIRLRAIVALCVALAAQDRAHEALALCDASLDPAHTLKGPKDKLLQVRAYLHWCTGHFGVTELADAQGSEATRGAGDERSRVLQLVERGEVAAAEICAARLSVGRGLYPSDEWNNRILCADFYFLIGHLEAAAVSLGTQFVFLGKTPNDEMVSVRRSNAMMAFVDLARGNRSHAILGLVAAEIMHTKDPEMAARLSAFHAFASGLFEADRQNPEGAVSWFTRARAHLAEWSRTGLDRRSLHRASLAVDLAHATIDPAPTDPVGVARQLVERAVALLGPTAEDFIARVLAVEARRELAHGLADRGDDEATAEAHRALDLARPLAGRGVPAWEAILAATEREALIG